MKKMCTVCGQEWSQKQLNAMSTEEYEDLVAGICCPRCEDWLAENTDEDYDLDLGEDLNDSRYY